MIFFDYILGRIRKKDGDGGGGVGLTPNNSLIEVGGTFVELNNDEASPGNFKAYGTNGSGVKGWFGLPEMGGMGAYFQWAEDDTESSTTSGLYQEKLKLTTTNLPAHDYAIFWVASVRTSDTDMQWRVQLNDATDVVVSNHSNGQSSVFSGFKVLPLSGVNEIDIDYNDAGGGTAYIKDARLFIFQVPENLV